MSTVRSPNFRRASAAPPSPGVVRDDEREALVLRAGPERGLAEPRVADDARPGGRPRRDPSAGSRARAAAPTPRRRWRPSRPPRTRPLAPGPKRARTPSLPAAPRGRARGRRSRRSRARSRGPGCARSATTAASRPRAASVARWSTTPGPSRIQAVESRISGIGVDGVVAVEVQPEEGRHGPPRPRSARRAAARRPGRSPCRRGARAPAGAWRGRRGPSGPSRRPRSASPSARSGLRP